MRYRCEYKLHNLLKERPFSELTIEKLDDTTILVVDKNFSQTITSKSFYRFDSNNVLRQYSFLLDNTNSNYSENFDSIGNLINKTGDVLLETRIWKKENDTLLFNMFLSALQKEYKDICIIINDTCTIYPKLLYKSQEYSNVKCFSFKKRIVFPNNKKDLSFVISGLFQNNCNKSTDSFRILRNTSIH